MKKRLLLAVLVFVMLLSLTLTGCKKKDKDNGGENPGEGTGETPGTETPGTGETPGTETPGTETPGTGDGGSTETPGTGGGTTDTPTDTETSKVVFSSANPPTIISATGAYNSDYFAKSDLDDLQKAIMAKINTFTDVTNDKGSAVAHEIVIGDSNREITKKAMEYVDSRLKREIRLSTDQDTAEQDLVCFAIYSEGGSVAIALSDWRIEEKAIEYFIDNYVIDSSLVLRDGYIKTEVFSITDYLKEREDNIIAKAWDTLEDQLVAVGADNADEIISAYKNLYTLYDQSMIVWYANLCDPVTGGVYHSNSARDNHGFLPDIENTYVLMSFIDSTGVSEMRGKKWTNVMPKDWQKRMGDWLLSMEDPDTFFYHPQWPKEFIVANGLQSRITRDRGSAKNLLSSLGRRNELQYSSITVNPSDERLPGKLGQSSVSAVSSVVLVNELLSQYDSVENFRVYLDGLEEQVLNATSDDNYAYQFYWMGNQFQSTVNYITADKTGEMRRMLIDFFEKYQNPETGMWDKTPCYNSTNGLHKVGAVLNSLGHEFKYTDQMIDTVIDILLFDMSTPEKTANAGTSIYNALSCFDYVYNNIRNYGSGTIEEKNAKITEYKDKVFKAMPDIITYARNQMAGFRRDDGSYGYSREGSSPKAQGAPTALSGVHEGDVNGNAIASWDIIIYIHRALGINDEYVVPMFTEEDCNVFINIVENLGEVIKNEKMVDEEQFFNFEDTYIGEVPDEISVKVDSGRIQNTGSHAYVVDDGTGNKALEYVGTERETDNGRNVGMGFDIPNVSPVSNVASISMKMKFYSEGSDVNAQLIQFNLEGSGSPVLYPTFRINKSGEVWYHNSGGEAIAKLGMVDEWFDFRLEYYWDEGIYKIYVDGIFRVDGTDTYNARAHQEVTSVGMSAPSTTCAHYLIDDVCFAKIEKKYVDGARELLPEKIYSFNSDNLHTDIVASGDYAFEAMGEAGGFALNAKGATFTVPANLRTYMNNVNATEFILTVPEAASVDADSVISTVTLHNELGTALWTVDMGIDANGKLYFANDVCLPDRVTADVDVASGVKVRFEAYCGVGASGCDNVLLVYAGDMKTPLCFSITMSGSPETKNQLVALTFGSKSNTLDVLYDDIKSELVRLEYKSPMTYPTVTPGPDAPTLGFDDYNVGTLPDRITGDASVGIELDGSDRFLQIVDDSKTASKTVLIDLFKKSNNVNSSIIEFEYELLNGMGGEMAKFILVDSQGNEDAVFYINHQSDGVAMVLRPLTCQSYTAELAAAGRWSWSQQHTTLDGSPSIVTRSNYQNGLLSYAKPCTSKVKITMEIDWLKQTVSVRYNEGRNSHYANYGDTVYTMKLKDVAQLKIVTGLTTTSTMNFDDLRAESFYTTPPTANQSPNHGFNGAVNGAEINGYVQNGVQIKPGSGTVKYNGEGDVYLDVIGGTIGSNPTIRVPMYTAGGVTPNKAVIEVDLEADRLLSTDSIVLQLLDGSGEGIVGITMKESGSKLKMYHTSGNLSSIIRYVYSDSSFEGGVIPYVSTSTFGTLSTEAREGLATRFILVVEYHYETGLMNVGFKTGNEVEFVYSALCTSVEAVSALKIAAADTAAADFNVYSVYAENVFDSEAGGTVIFAPTVKDFEGDYSVEHVEWECTHSGHKGEPMQSADNLIFEDGIKVYYSAGENYANVHGSTAEILSEGGNKFVHIVVPKRVSDRDRGYSVGALTEICTTDANVYVLEARIRFDSASTTKSFLQISFYNGEKQYAQIMMDNSSSVVSIQGVKVGAWDKWLNLRFEYYPEEEIMQVYESGNFKGNIYGVYTSSSGSNKTVTAIGDKVTDIAIGGVNSASTGYIMDIDNVACYATNKTYEEGVLTAVVENFEGAFTVDTSGIAPNISFESGTDISYGGSTNDVGSYAEVITEGGNTYVHFEVNKRVDSNSKDRGYSVVTNIQNIATNANAHVYEARLRFDSWSTAANNTQIVFRDGAGNYGQYTIANTKDYVGLGGVKIANWDEWFNLRLVQYPDEGVIYVYAAADGTNEYKYRGMLSDFDASNEQTGKLVANLGPMTSINLSQYNASGSAIMDLDDLVFYNANLEFTDMSDATIEELPAPNLKGERPEYKVEFKVDGESYYSVTLPKANSTVTMPAEPKKAGYVFNGWYVDAEYTVPFTADYFVSSPLTGPTAVYAKFVEAEKFTVTYVVDGETYHSELVAANAAVALPEPPTKAGEKFEGWYLDEECTVAFNPAAPLTEPLTADVVLYAKFVVEYAVTFVVDGAEYVTVVLVAGEKLELPVDPAKLGYTFIGWFVDEECTVALTADYFVNNPITEDVSVYAAFEVVEITPDSDEPVYDGTPDIADEGKPDGSDFDDWT